MRLDGGIVPDERAVAKAIREAVASVRLEGLESSEFDRRLQAEVVAGRLSLDEAITRAKAYYRTLAEEECGRHA